MMSTSGIEGNLLVVHSRIHPVTEALAYFTRKANDRYISTAVKEMHIQYPESKESIDSLFGILENLERQLDDVSAEVDSERMHFFFDDLGEGPARAHGSNLAAAVMMPMLPEYGSFTTLESYRQERRNEAVELTIFRARLAFSVQNEKWFSEECKDFSAFYDYISEFPATEAERYRILGAVRNSQDYIDELAQMIAPVVEAISRNESLYQPLLERFSQVYRGKHAEEVFCDGEDARVLDRSADVVELFPSLFLISNSYTMTYQQTSDAPVCNCIEMGVLHDAFKLYGKRDIPLKDVASYVKAIGDPVRLQILSILKDDEVYVQELTEKLGLSFTTLSHHMTKLMMAGLITSERRGIYVYYRTNTDFLRWLMDHVESLILN